MTLRKMTGWFVVAAAFVSSWNAVSLRGIQPVDVLVAIAVALTVLSFAGGSSVWIPRWVKLGSASIILVMIIHLVVPTSPTYMSQRFIYLPWFVQVTGANIFESGIERGAKWLLALAVVPILVAESARHNEEIVNRVARAWLAGAALSAFIAVTDLLGITSINTFLIVIGGATARQSGLTAHPNHLGMSVSMVVPLAIGLALRSRWKGAIVTTVLMAGAIVSGSRAGQAGFVLAVTATLAFSARARRYAPVLIVSAGIAMASIVWVKPGLVDTVATLFRFDTTDRYVAQSNEERANLSKQAVMDFRQRPIDGVGLEVLAQAHNIYLQIVAGGGLILAIGMLAYFRGIIKAAYAERASENPLAVYLLVAIGVWLAAGTFGTQLTDRYLYFPVGAIAALQAARIRKARALRREKFVAATHGMVTDPLYRLGPR